MKGSRSNMALAAPHESLNKVTLTGGSSGKVVVTGKENDYQRLVSRVRQIVAGCLSPQATVLVLSRGDSELLRLEGRRAWHFPCTEHGDYTGHYPADSSAAIRHLEQLRAKGADHILFPATAFWWLEFYAGFRRHLENCYVVAARDETACLVFSLRNRKPELNGVEAGFHMDGSEERPVTLVTESIPCVDTKPLSSRDRAPDDHNAECELSRLARQNGRPDVVEERLTRLAELCRLDVPVQAELVNFYCALLENGSCAVDECLLCRFFAHLRDPAKMRRLPADIHLLVTESLAANGEIEPALASLDAALRTLNFASEALQNFVLRLLRTIETTKSAIPFEDGVSLAAFLTHAGNNFAAAQERFKSEACYHLAIASDSSGWNSASRAARFNLAFHEMARGNAVGVLNHLSKVSSLDPEKTAAIVWPEHNGAAWPHAQFDLRAAFEKLKPAGRAWPTITVITPSFNQAEYVEETLLSVLNQFYPALEYIVLDGASTDGTVDILKRYEPLISKLIIEPDEGQADAVNKGLRISTGEVILWINSDDMLGPGSLFIVALAYLIDEADIISGFCCEHTGRRFGVIHLPAVTNATFNVECLGDIFKYWLQGHYFYQPEVAFSRRILERAGGHLCKDLHYTMDYEFWLRCAQAGTRPAVVHWPIGFFRRHDKQKTACLDQTIIEQARVRDRFVLPEPGFERKLEIRQRVHRAFSRPAPEVSIVSSRKPDLFSRDTGRELNERLAADGFRMTFYSDFESLRPGEEDLVIVLMHLDKEHEKLRSFRDAGHDGLIAGWFWDNHHHVFENYRSAADLDVCIPGYGFAGSYLRSSRFLMAPPVPLCVTQWSGDEARMFFEKYGLGHRSNALDRGFVGARSAGKQDLLEQLMAENAEGVYLPGEPAPDRDCGPLPEDRFKSCASRKTSICPLVSDELPRGLLETLLTGQVPIVPHDMYDLDQLIPRQAQEALPIVRFASYTLAAVEQAHATALQLFDRDGEAGALRRHHFTLRNHMFEARVRTIVSTIRNITSFAIARELDEPAGGSCKWQ